MGGKKERKKERRKKKERKLYFQNTSDNTKLPTKKRLSLHKDRLFPLTPFLLDCSVYSPRIQYI
jgi:hypothetical protein